MKYSMIVAYFDKTRIYGATTKDGKEIVPFNLPGEMTWYRKKTKNHLCLVTRKTFTSMVQIVHETIPDKDPLMILTDLNREYCIVSTEGLEICTRDKSKGVIIKKLIDNNDFSKMMTAVDGIATAKGKPIMVLGGAFLWMKLNTPQKVYRTIVTDEDLVVSENVKEYYSWDFEEILSDIPIFPRPGREPKFKKEEIEFRDRGFHRSVISERKDRK